MKVRLIIVVFLTLLIGIIGSGCTYNSLYERDSSLISVSAKEKCFCPTCSQYYYGRGTHKCSRAVSKSIVSSYDRRLYCSECNVYYPSNLKHTHYERYSLSKTPSILYKPRYGRSGRSRDEYKVSLPWMEVNLISIVEKDTRPRYVYMGRSHFYEKNLIWFGKNQKEYRKKEHLGTLGAHRHRYW